MKTLLPFASVLLVLAACGPRFEPAPRPLGGYPTLILNDTIRVPVRSVTATVTAGTRLVADGTIGGETVFCGPALVAGFTERLCFARRGPTCLSADAVGAPVCFRPGLFLEDWT
jgi:hypothetical protein